MAKPAGPHERKRVEEILNTEIEYKGRKLQQFGIGSFYMAQNKAPHKPIQTVHGLSNYSHLKLGDDRLLVDASMTHMTFNPKISAYEKNYGLSDEKKRENRRRDYEYALKMTAKDDLDKISKVIKEKLGQRTRAGPLQLRNTFKFFDRDGSGGISLSEIRWAFAHMGFTFKDIEVAALYAQLDSGLTGIIRYQTFIDLLSERDFLEVTHSWQVPKKDRNNHTHTPRTTAAASPHRSAAGPRQARAGGDRRDPLSESKAKQWREAEYDDDLSKSEEMEKEEAFKLFHFVNRTDTGFLTHSELQALLLILGIKYNRKSLEHCVHDIDPSGTGLTDFPTFWACWCQKRILVM